MAVPTEQMDPYWKEYMELSEWLLVRAVYLFKGRGCFGVEAILPGTGMCAVDLVEKTTGDLTVKGDWIPGSGNIPYALAGKALTRDFLDLVKSAGFKSTVIIDSVEREYFEKRMTVSETVSKELEAKAKLDALLRYFANDQSAIEMLKVMLEKGLEKPADIARESKISVREVNNTRKRVSYKLEKFIELWERKERQ